MPFHFDGYGLDRAIAAMFLGAKRGETVSVIAGHAAEENERWACWLCWLLAHIVEPDHCARSILDDHLPTSKPAAYRAGLLLIAFTAAVWATPVVAWHLIKRGWLAWL